jgi:hypothetical protein
VGAGARMTIADDLFAAIEKGDVDAVRDLYGPTR